ncbi:MAG: tetratricopeptide repeat protein, partial [Pseudomonadota bacterium]
DVEAFVDRGRAYLRAADLAAAEKDFTKALELEPNSVAALRERGHARLLLEKFDEAAADLDASLKLAPRQPEAFAYRALMFKKMGQPKLGEREIRTAEQYGASNAIVMWARGEINEALGNEDVAVTSFRAALAQRPDLTPARYGLGRLGERDKSQAISVVAGAVNGWDIIRRNGQFFARRGEPKPFEVPLESVADATPQIRDWTERDVGGRKIGLLKYAQGRLSEAGKTVPLETSVIIDLRRREVLGSAPTRFGDKRAQVAWNAASVEIIAVDGLTDQIAFTRTPSPSAVAAARATRRARKRRTRQARRRDTWVPWERASRGFARPRRARSNRRSRRRRRPRTLFDLLTGN